MKIERMKEEHREEVLAMMRTFYASPAVLSDGSEAIFQADIDACVKPGPYAQGFVMTQDGALAGYCMIAKSFSTEFGRRCVWIEDLYLRPEYRGRGLGSQMLQYLIRKYPGAILRLEAERGNARALEVYRKNGFDELPYAELKRMEKE